MIAQIQIRRGSTAEWTTSNPVLASGEFGLDEDTGVTKLGDGVQTWSQLPVYGGGPIGLVGRVENKTAVVTYSNSTPAIIEGMILAVPPNTERELDITWGLTTAMALGGEGSVQSILYETTNGSPYIVGWSVKKYGADNVASAQGFTHEGHATLDPSAVWRTFLLYFSHYSQTGSTITAYATNANTPYGKTFLQGEYI